MKVKNIVRKAVALGSGAVIGGASLMGALAYDLSTYPANFIVDGQFDGTIVVGENAATADVLGSIDIAASLQAASVSAVPVAGGATTVSLSGDAFELSTGADRLELREPIGNVVESVTADNLAGLKSGKITTSKGTTGYTQFIRLQDSTTPLQNITVNYVKNDGERKEVMADYLVIDAADQAFLQWEIQFDQGLKSELTTTAGVTSANNFEDRSFNIMGTDFTIVKADVTTAADTVEMTLMGGSVPDTLREGETKTYTINGVDYEVTLVFVSDPNTGSTQAKFSVNGELTDAMGEGETEILSGGLQIGVRDVLVNAREGVASFFLGAHKIVLTDTNYTLADFQDGSIEINDDSTESQVLDIGASFTSATNRFEITSIKYRVRLESVEGAGGIAFIPAGKGAREFMDEPELLISDSLDLYYGGLTEVDSADVKFSPVGDTRYTLSFTNIQGKQYTSVPFLSGKTSFHFGANDYDLEYTEGKLVNTTTTIGNVYNIGVNEYFILSKERADQEKAVTNILRYRDYDSSKRTLEFEDLAGGTIRTVVDTTTRRGTLNVGGTSYTVEVNDTDLRDAPLFVDLNADNVFTDNAAVSVTTWGGLVISWDANKNFQALMTESQFDTSGVDEKFNWTVSASGEDLDLDFNESKYVGPLSSGTGAVRGFQFDEIESDSEKSVGMTDYGILITETNPDTSSDPNTLTLSVPSGQRFAQVFVTLGDVTASAGGAGSAQRVNPIAVGLAVLDSNAPAIGSDNLIVVGGPCANTVAAELLGNPEQCGADFEPGKAVIKSWDKNGKVAILVAGYEATETLGASRVLAAYSTYDLKGTEVEVVVADLNSISVKPAQ